MSMFLCSCPSRFTHCAAPCSSPRGRRALLGVLATLASLTATSACVEAAPEVEVMDASVLFDDHGLSSALLCPGAIGCEDATGELRVGAGALTITPAVTPDGPPVWLAGFDIGRQATGVHDDQWTRAIVWEQGATSIGLVVVDAVGLFLPEAQRIRVAARAAGLTLDHIIVATTHVHSAKDTMGLWGEAVGKNGIDPAYMDEIAEKSVAALDTAWNSRAPALLRFATADASPWVRDARAPVVIDSRVATLDFVRADASSGDAASSIATLVVWGNHPEALGSGNTLATSDYPHYLRAEVEARLPGTVAVFAPGLLGGITTPIGALVCPDSDGVETCPQGTFERAERIGTEVAQRATDAVIEAPFVDVALGARRLGVFLAPRNLPLALAFQLDMIRRPVWDEDGEPIPADVLGQLSIDEVMAGDLRIGSELGSLSFGAVALTTIPGELYSELWLARPDGSSFVEQPEGRDFPDAAPEPAFQTLVPPAAVQLVLNNANDAIGYILPRPQWDSKAPRSYQDEGQYGEQNSVGPDTSLGIMDGLKRMTALKSLSTTRTH